MFLTNLFFSVSFVLISFVTIESRLFWNTEILKDRSRRSATSAPLVNTTEAECSPTDPACEDVVDEPTTVKPGTTSIVNPNPQLASVPQRQPAASPAPQPGAPSPTEPKKIGCRRDGVFHVLGDRYNNTKGKDACVRCLCYRQEKKEPVDLRLKIVCTRRYCPKEMAERAAKEAEAQVKKPANATKASPPKTG